MREITHMMGAKLASAAVMAAVCSADLACGDTPIWGTAELIVEIGIESFRATGFAALGPEDFVVSDGDISMTVYRIVDNEPALLGNITDCDELLYRRVWNTDSPTLLLTSGNRVLSLDAATGTYSICSVGSNVQSLAVTPVGNISFENRAAADGRIGEISECGPYTTVATGLPDWADFTGCSPTYLPVTDGVWMCTYREGDTCVTSLFASDGAIITPAVVTTHPMPETSAANFIQRLAEPLAAGGMEYGMVVDTTIVGFGLDGASAVLADGVEFIKGVPGRVVFDPAPEVVGSAFVMRSVPGIVRIYQVDSSGPDCNLDGIPDYEEIAAGAPDTNANGVPDTCECFADVNQDGVVNGADISAVLGFWGLAGKPLPAADITRDGIVDGADLAVLLGSWGPCQ